MVRGGATEVAGLPRAVPETLGVSSAQLLKFLKAADTEVNTMHSFMLVRHGRVAAEAWWNPQTPETRHVLWSLSKSFTSTAVGLAIHEGRLSLHDEVLKFFPEYTPAQPSANLKQMRVHDLLRMSAGHETEADLRGSSRPWPQTFLEHPVPYKPGTHFRYNTPATYMLSAVVQKAAGQTLMEYLKPRLFDPLGITGHHWDSDPQGVNIGGYGLYLRTEDIAKFGQLLLQRGRWQGKQLVPEDWVKAATSLQTSNGSNPESDWDQGYGYQFWRCRFGAFRGDGAFGQFCIVLPDRDAVIAMTAQSNDMQKMLNIVWRELLPAFAPKGLPKDTRSLETLKEYAAGLKAKQ
jgi:CubicO group peptidase (beta-lactamase class C family)